MLSVLSTGRLTRVAFIRASSVGIVRTKLLINLKAFQFLKHQPLIHANTAFRSLCISTTVAKESKLCDTIANESKLCDDTYVGNMKDGKRHGQGILSFQNGQILEGEFRDDRFYNGKCILNNSESAPVLDSSNELTEHPLDESGEDGSAAALPASEAHLKAALASPVGRVYEGEFLNGSLHGYGRVTHADGRVLSGEFKNGHLWSGVGTKGIGGGRVYEGDFRHGKMNGKGKITNSDGSVLEGEFKKGDVWTGTGVKQLQNGKTYTGIWHKGKIHGEGKVQLLSGDVWVGQFLHGKEYTGHGKIEMMDGRLYQGSLVEGKMHGEGGKLITQGAVQEGEFKYGFFRMGSQRPAEKTDFFRPHLPAPVSKSIDRPGIKYEGDRADDGKKHGFGVLSFKNGKSWEGSFKEDHMHSGEGYVELEDGRTYEGEWVEGNMHGEGALYRKNVLCWKGEFMLGQKLPNGSSVDGDEARRRQQRAAKFKEGLFKKKKKRVWRENKYKC